MLLKKTTSGVFDPGLSDHYLIYGSRNLHKDKTPPKYLTVKNYKHLNIKNLKYDMECAPWPVLESFDNIDDMTWAWETIYKNILNKHLSEGELKFAPTVYHKWTLIYGKLWKGDSKLSILQRKLVLKNHGMNIKNLGMKLLISWGLLKQITRNKSSPKSNQARTSGGWSEN